MIHPSKHSSMDTGDDRRPLPEDLTVDTTGDDRRYLPEDLTVDILLRLPLASLLRFKSVCKEWYSIIHSPAFNRSWSGPPKILVYNHSGCRPGDDSPPNPNPITLLSTSDGVHECPDYLQGFRGVRYLLGSVDGLFLLETVIDSVYDIRLALWNPATREVRHLPGPNLELPPRLRKSGNPQFGFGLDPKTNDYKVVWFRLLRDKEDKGCLVGQLYAAVYSCSRDSWRIIHPENHETFKRSYFRDAICPAYLNGVYYWLIIPRAIFSKSRILSFDFGDEVFREITGPDVDGRNRLYQKLILFDGSVALLNPVDRINYDIWVMLKPGVWNKLFNFRCFGNFGYIRSWNTTTAIFISQDHCLVSYDVQTQESRYLGSSRYPGMRYLNKKGTGCSFHFYKERLVPMKQQRPECRLAGPLQLR